MTQSSTVALPAGGAPGISPHQGATGTTWIDNFVADNYDITTLPSIPAPTYTQAFTGSDGAAWPGWSVVATQGTTSATIQGNKGEQRLATTGTEFRADQLSWTPDDFEFYGEFDVVSGQSLILRVLGRLTADFVRQTIIEMGIDAGYFNLVTTTNSAQGGAGTVTVATASYTYITGTHHIRVRMFENTVVAKVWFHGTNEPVNWMVTGAALDRSGAGHNFALLAARLSGTGPSYVRWDNISLRDHTLTPLAPPTGGPVALAGASAGIATTTAVMSGGTSGLGLWKGVGIIIPDGNVPGVMASLHASWWFDWGNYSVTTPPHENAPGYEYVPMMWGDWVNESRFDIGGPPSASIGTSTTLLGFNEPDQSGQSSMSPARALELWPQLEATGARLGSPAPGGGGLAWLATFMAGNPRVDFICAHWYVDFNMGYTDVGAFLDYLHTTYNKPIWLTEVGNLSGGTAANTSLVPTVMTALSTRPWVERVAWFVARDANSGWPGTGLVNANGTLTTTGTAYAPYPAGPVSLAGTAAGVATATATTMVRGEGLGSTVAGLSTTTATLSVGHAIALAGQADGTSTTTADLITKAALALAGSSAGISTATAGLNKDFVLGTVTATAGTSTTLGTLSKSLTLTGQADGVSAADGTMSVAVRLSVAFGNVVGISTATATTLATDGSLGGSSAGVSAVTKADLGVTRGLASGADGISTVTATTMIRNVGLAGRADGTSTTSGLATDAGKWDGHSQGTSTVTCDLSVQRGLSGRCDGTSTTTPALAMDLRLAAPPVVGVATATASRLDTDQVFGGTINGTSTAVGTMLLAVDLAGPPLAGVGTVTVSMQRTRGLASNTSTGRATTTANLTVFLVGGPVRIWDGTKYVAAILRVWDGRQWVPGELSVWDGSDFQVLS